MRRPVVTKEASPGADDEHLINGSIPEDSVQPGKNCVDKVFLLRETFSKEIRPPFCRYSQQAKGMNQVHFSASVFLQPVSVALSFGCAFRCDFPRHYSLGELEGLICAHRSECADRQLFITYSLCSWFWPASRCAGMQPGHSASHLRQHPCRGSTSCICNFPMHNLGRSPWYRATSMKMAFRTL